MQKHTTKTLIRLLPYIIIILTTVFAYSNIFTNQLVGDDHDFITNWTLTRSWSNLPQLLIGATPPGNEGVYRPIRSLAYFFMYQLFDTQPLPYHIFSLSIHIITSILVYQLSYLLLKHKSATLITALLFATHPIHIESITYITSSFDALGFLFFFGSIVAFIQSFNSKKYHLYSISLFLASLAFFTEELTLSLPLILHLWIYLYHQKIKPIKPFYFIAAMYVLIRTFLLHSLKRGDYGYLAGSFPLTLQATFKAFLLYLKLHLLPLNLSLDHTISPGISTFVPPILNTDAALNQSLTDPTLILSLILITILLILAFKLHHRSPLISFTIGWFFLALLPVSNLIPIYTPMREMYAYIASFAFCLAVGVFFHYLCQKKYFPKTIIALPFILFIIWFGVLTYQHNQVWQSEITLWQYTAQHSPQNPIVLYKLGSAYQQDNQLDSALETYHQSIRYNPNLSFVYFNIGNIYQSQNQFDQATEAYSQAYQLDPKSSLYLQYLSNNLYQQAITSIESQNYVVATKLLQQVISLKPQHLDALVNLGTLAALQKNYQQAKSYYQQALSIDPAYSPATENLSKLPLN